MSIEKWDSVFQVTESQKLKRDFIQITSFYFHLCIAFCLIQMTVKMLLNHATSHEFWINNVKIWKIWTTYYSKSLMLSKKGLLLIVRAIVQQGRTRLTHLRTELYSNSFHAMLALSCGPAKFQCCTATVTVVVYWFAFKATFHKSPNFMIYWYQRYHFSWLYVVYAL